MKNPSRQALTSLLLTLALGGTVAACGNDDSDAGSGANASDTGPATASATPASAADVDQAFVRQMVPHHQMAVVMAESALQRADHTELKTLSTAIVRAQKKEIADLTEVGKDLGAKTDHSSMMGSDAQTLGLSMDEMGMSMDMNDLGGSGDFDREFIDQMTVHHRGAIAMAKAELSRGGDERLQTIAREIISAQEKEIAQMGAWRAAWFGTADVPDDAGDHMGHTQN
ncbi:MAG: DUF305 domain-containing protein [Solirubrobacteraceae bacterium]|nr:DUF305 domain-containing protein [Solirubrobacteraceae bacterium]